MKIFAFILARANKEQNWAHVKRTLLCCRRNRDLITVGIRALFWCSSVWPAPALWTLWGEIASSGSRRLRNTLQLLHAPRIYANHCNYSPFGCAYFQQVLFEYKAPRDPEDTARTWNIRVIWRIFLLCI